jgi:23S rRNA-/tRNA-specific pseudouridylate synthase
MEWTSKHKARITDFLAKDRDSQLAITNYLVMKEKKLSDILWRNFIGMKIITGRKHQIRCQLSQHLLNPIINDDLYLGRKAADIGQAIYLHAFGLKISSPTLIEKIFKLDSDNGVVLDN